MDLILKQCNILFRKEWGLIVDQYNQMRNSLYTAETALFTCEAQKFYLEKELAQLKDYIAEKRPKYLPDYVVDWAGDEPGEIDTMAINEANCILTKPISFYGGYVMEVMYKKDEILE